MRTVGIVLVLLIVLSLHESGCSEISSVPATVCFFLHIRRESEQRRSGAAQRRQRTRVPQRRAFLQGFLHVFAQEEYVLSTGSGEIDRQVESDSIEHHKSISYKLF